MRCIAFTFIILLSISTGCESKQLAAGNASPSEQAPSTNKTIGKVSHQYQSTGCSTVVVIHSKGNTGTITLIPKDKLSTDIDVDGLEISFDYRTLRMPQPAGCSVGMPAELSNITKTKK